MTDDTDPLLESFMHHELMEETTGYLQRGRAHRMLETAEVEDRWVEAFKAWAAGGYKGGARDMDDCGAELRLRGLDPPYERVSAEIAEVGRKLQDLGPLEDDDPLRQRLRAYLNARDDPSA
jgi:hypothetical protein